jgi:hypothetical protein
MRAREAEGIQIEVPGGCLRLEGSPGQGATLLLSVSYWLQRSRPISVTCRGGAARITPGPIRGHVAPAWCTRDCGRGPGRARLQGEIPPLQRAPG